ncbi:hypothetical protein C1H76_6716 [Elsinoe australis]|uniref:Uncharacterized protein n=1 Tax=Elsinoe australis TaxID=40998 RepID=A0A4U7AVG5_9PEZI|nr:hypothetical protein C1H76_6716 [Elsinoe australis]
MALRNWESPSTRHHWSGIASPAKWLFAFLALSIVTLVVTIPVNATVANEPDNDYAYGFGWALMMPVPIIALLWTLVDIFICRSSTLHPIYALVASILLAIGYFCVGLLTILFFSYEHMPRTLY